MNTRRLLHRLSTLAALCATALCATALPGAALACEVRAATSRPGGAQEMGATITCPWTQAIMPAWFSSSQLSGWNRHLKLAGPRLRGHHERLVASGYGRLTFEEFAYIDLMTMCAARQANAAAAQSLQQKDQRRLLDAEYAGNDPGVCAAWGMNTRPPAAR